MNASPLRMKRGKETLGLQFPCSILLRKLQGLESTEKDDRDTIFGEVFADICDDIDSEARRE